MAAPRQYRANPGKLRAAIPTEHRRRLRGLARREQAQASRDRYWAKRLMLFFGVAIGLYSIALPGHD